MKKTDKLITAEKKGRKKIKGKIYLLLMLLLIILISAAAVLLNRKEDVPAKHLLHPGNVDFGADFSTWQDPSVIDYDKLAPRLDFAILRIGFTDKETGEFKKDDCFEQHYEEFSRRRVPLGAYWYSDAKNEKEGKAEAEAVLKYIAGKNFSHPVFIDIEDPSLQAFLPSDLTDAALSFMKVLEKGGYSPGFYSNAYFLSELIYSEKLSAYSCWAAQYHDWAPELGIQYWQYTNEGRLPGYDGSLDLNLKLD